MKILHTSDLHIGSPLTSRLSADKVRARKNELIANFESMIEEAVYRRIPLFIIAGDLFDSERITSSVAERVLGAIARNPSVEFLYLSGNHEKNALIESGVTLPKNLRLFGEDWTYFACGDVNVVGRSEISENMFSTLMLDPMRTNIVVLHGALADGKSGGEIIGKRDLEGLRIDYLALGHYHSYSVHQISDTGIFPGSGIGNMQRPLNESTVGVPVIAIGVPTVINARILTDEQFDDGIVPTESMFVSPRDIDTIAEVSSKIISIGINQAFGVF